EVFGLADEMLSDNPIVPLLTGRTFARYCQPVLRQLKALGQGGVGLLVLFDLMLSHRQNHQCSNGPLAIARSIDNFLHPFDRAGEVALAILSQAFDELKIIPRFMFRTSGEIGRASCRERG